MNNSNTIYNKTKLVKVYDRLYKVMSVELTPYGKPIRAFMHMDGFGNLLLTHDYATQEWYLISGFTSRRMDNQELIDRIIDQYLKTIINEAILK